MRIVNVTDVKPGAFAGETARAKGGEPPLVSQLGKGVRLVHELGELRPAKELPQRGHDRADVHQVAGRRALRLHQCHALSRHALHSEETNTELILDQFADGSDSAIAEVIDVIWLGHAILHADHLLDEGDDVFRQQDAGIRDPLPRQDCDLACNVPPSLGHNDADQRRGGR